MWISCSGILYGQTQSNKYVKILKWHDEQQGIYNLGILNGPLYEFKKTSPKTHQFLISPAWHKGTFVIKGEEYHEVDIVFDLSQECLVMKHPDPGFNFGIQIKNVETFNIYDLRFVWLDESFGDAGYYNELFEGDRLGLYVKRFKKELAVESETAFREFSYYYILYRGRLRPYRNLRSIYELAPEHKHLVKKLKKEAKLRPTIKREQDIVKLISMLDHKEEFSH